MLQRRHLLLDLVDEVVPVATPSGTPDFRNRFVKTQLPQLLSKDSVYLDGDTVLIAPVDEIFETTASFAAVPNHNGNGSIESAFASEVETFARNGWERPMTPYVNGGVLFFRPSIRTRKFGDTWHCRWLQASKEGSHRDQPSLNSALNDSGIDYALLPQRFNAQMQARPRAAIGAAIWHMYGSLAAALSTCGGWHGIVDRYLSIGSLDVEAVERFCRQPLPWSQSSIFDALVVRYMLRGRHFLPLDAFERKWLSGRQLDAMEDFASRIFRSTKANLRNLAR